MQLPRLETAARAGFVAVATDARFHGGRAGTPYAFKNALLKVRTN